MLKNLKSLFVVEEDSPKEPKETPSDSKDDAKPAASTPKQTVSTTISSSGAVDNRILEKLLKVIEANNLEGFDYLEYKKSLKALEKMPMDEATKYRSAFATASTMGVTLSKLVESANHYLGILKSENSNFTTASKDEVKRRVSDKEGQVTQYENLIKEKSEKIKALTEEISKHQAQIEQLKADISKGKGKIDKTLVDFEQSYLYLKNQLETDVANMTKYLK